MALPNYDAVRPATPSHGSRNTRMAMVGTGILLGMVGAVALLTSAPSPASTTLIQEHKGLAIESPDQKLQHIALHILEHGADMPVSEMEKKLQEWHDNPATLVAVEPKQARVQMLSDDFSRGRGDAFSMTLAEGDSKLCKKKDIIIEKFDQLLKRLGGEELSANITMGKVTAEWKKAMETWLDSESTYRLTIEKSKEATEGASFARSEYEKWAEAHKAAKSALATIVKRHGEERKNLDLERELIKEIMRLIGVLHDIPVTAKSKAAGGTESKKDSKTGVSDPYASTLAKTKAQLAEKISQLRHVSSSLSLPGSATQLAQIQQLPVYSETQEVAKILKQMLKDIEDRKKVLAEVEKKAKEGLSSAFNKMVEWEKKLVVLADAADKAKEQVASVSLTRQNLAGKKTVAANTHKEEKAAYKLIIPPYQREIYVITMIKKKINDHCAKLSKAA